MDLADAIDGLSSRLQAEPGFVALSEDARDGEVVIIVYFARSAPKSSAVPPRHGGFRVVVETVDGIEPHAEPEPR